MRELLRPWSKCERIEELVFRSRNLASCCHRVMSPTDKLTVEAPKAAKRPQRYGEDFYTQGDTVSLARSLLGARLVSVSRGALTSGMIVEVEAYLGSDDPACHAARGKTPRNEVMFLAGGHCYVYLIYGMYLCMNVVGDPEGVGTGVLLRAIEPLEGLAVMQRRRAAERPKRIPVRDLARGPGRLCQALGISRTHGGQHFASSSRLWIEPYRDVAKDDIATSSRIGVTNGAELPLRFYVKNSPWVSGCIR
jgi:DNA-3-methyladenine glycosylase